MRYTKKELYELLPAIYRQRDIDEGKPLEALLSVIAEQVGILEEDIERLHNNWFIETCDPWVVPYIGDLVGTTALRAGTGGTVNLRALVASTIRYRRRKGTLLVLEQLASDVTGWNVRVVEFFKLLSTTQHLNHLRLSNFRTPDLREIETLDLLNTPFDAIAHTVDVHGIRDGRRYYNIPNIGIFLWRLQAYPVDDAPAFEKREGMFTFSQLGLDMKLFNHPEAETSPEHIAEEINVPRPIRTNGLYRHLGYYYASEGKEKSIKISVDGSVKRAEDIIVCDLSDWDRRPPEGKVAIDPERGRIVFPKNGDPKSVRVSYYYGSSSELGGGFYQRPSSNLELQEGVFFKEISRNSSLRPIMDEVEQWYGSGKKTALLEITDSEFYDNDLDLELPPGSMLEIRSKQRRRPVLRGSITVTAGPRSDDELSHLMLDGLLIDSSIAVEEGNLGSLAIRHCTLVPKQNESLSVKGNDGCLVTLYRTIIGGIAATQSEAKIKMNDSIVDRRDELAIKCHELSAEECTVFGMVLVDVIRLASNTIFTDTVAAKRRQAGCVRFSYLPHASRVPRRYRCQPEQFSNARARKTDHDVKVRPRFTSERYGDPGYAQLSEDTPPEISEGADNGAEMGVFNHLQQAHRISNLRTCLDEYLRFGLEAGIFLES